MTPELIAILALGVPLIGLLLTSRRDARADNQALRADVLAQIQDLRQEVQAGDQRLREDLHAEMSNLHTDLSNLRTDVQALTERTARLEGAIQTLVAVRDDRDRQDDAA